MSWISPTRQERDLVRKIKDKDQRKLLQILSLALRLDFRLLRNARSEFTPLAPAEIELEIWHSDAVYKRSALGGVIQEGIARVLVDKLSDDDWLYQRGIEFINEQTRHWPDLARLEQKLRLASRTGDKQVLQKGYLRMLRTLLEAQQAGHDRLELARMIKGALPHLTPDQASFGYLQQYVGAALGSVVLGSMPMVSKQQAMPSWLAGVVPVRKPQPVGIKVYPGVLVGETPEAGLPRIAVNLPMPTQVLVTPNDDPSRAHWAPFFLGCRISIPERARSVRIKTLIGDCWLIKIEQDRDREESGAAIAHELDDRLILLHLPQDKALAGRIADWLTGKGIALELREEKLELAHSNLGEKPLICLWSKSASAYWQSIAEPKMPPPPGLLLRTDPDATKPAGSQSGQCLDLFGWDGNEDRTDARHLLDAVLALKTDEGAGQQSDYHYDVFISYSRTGMVEKIIKEHFYDPFHDVLENAMEDQAPRIFLDFDGIQYAQNFKAVLANALSRSIVFVPIFDVRYFRSDWCLKELCVAYEKQQEIFDRDKGGGTNIIFPVNVKSYEYQPKKLQHLKSFDLMKSVRTGDTLGLNLFISKDFDRFANNIAEVLKNPPAWEEHWSETEWIDNAIEEHMEDMKLGPKRPPDIVEAMDKLGKVVTFYSYKDDADRSMALANIAVLLALWGKKTLVVDWDLEAPGLETFFKTYCEPADFKGNGISDLLFEMYRDPSDPSKVALWKEAVITLRLADRKTKDAQVTVDFIGAGNRDSLKEYFRTVRRFDAEDFYKNEGLDRIEELRTEWIKAYDFVLVDSRSGVTDMSSICTVQLPDLLVVLFTPTIQALNGIVSVGRSAIREFEDLPVERFSYRVMPVASRIDFGSELESSQRWLADSANVVDEFYREWAEETAALDILRMTCIPHKAFPSFGENLLVINESGDDPVSMSYAYTNIAALLVRDLKSVGQLIGDREWYLRPIRPTVDVR